MSSTSSSECLCADCLNYAAAFRSPSFRNRAPYYQTLGHPLIYYAQLPAPNFHQRSRESRKENPNCFVKAFRWYTQDHYPPPATTQLPSDRTDLAGFAMWLDRKYDEFILEKRAEQDNFQTQPQISQISEDKSSNRVVFDQSNHKSTCSRVKSPFRKRRRTGSYVKECGDKPDKCNQSFEYILKPKELSRLASECFHQLPSSESQASKKTITKVRALSSERTVYEKCNSVPIEVIKIEGNGHTEEVSNSKKNEIKTIEYREPRCEVTPSYIKRALNDLSCQCPEKRLETQETHTQCEFDGRKTGTDHPLPDYYCCPNCAKRIHCVSEHSAGPSQPHIEISESKDKLEPLVKISERPIEKSDAQSQYTRENKDVECECSTSDENSLLENPNQIDQPMITPPIAQCPCRPIIVQPFIIRGSVNSAKVPKEPITTSDNDAQTSDHSIHLETVTYPLFMKIICADKLNEEFNSKM